MAFTIKIYEKNEYIYSLLKKRLISFFPDAYIVDPYIDEQDYADQFSTYTRVIYDPADININDVSHTSASPIRLTEDSGIIDCARLIPMLRSEEDITAYAKHSTGSLYAVLPFVYTDARDRFIRELSTELSDSDFNIRLDLTSKLRSSMKPASGCNMTSLLEACRSRKFNPEDILKYCNMDEYGFLTPGSTKGLDDVYDLGVERSNTLIIHAARLAHSASRIANVITIIEGFRTKDLPELLSSCDKVYLLLPSSSSEDNGTRELIAMLTKALGSERISVLYSGVTNDSDNSFDQRRLVV